MMKKNIIALLSTVCVSTMMFSGISFASGGNVGNLAATYLNSAISVTGDANAAKVVVQVWNSSQVMVTMDELIVVDGKINGTMYTGKLTNGSYTLKVADSSGGTYANLPINVTNSSGSNRNSGGSKGSGSTVPGTTTPEEGTTGATVKIALSADAVKAALSNAKNGKVVLEAKGTAGAQEITVSIPVDPLREAGVMSVKTVEVVVGGISISFSMDMLGAFTNVEFTVKKVDPSSLPDEIKTAIGDNAVYDFSLSADGKPISSFGKNDVTISMEYTLKAGEAPGKVIVYYIGDNSQLQTITNGSFNPVNGMVEFKPTHFSKYAAAYSEVTFNDLGTVEWAKESIEALAARSVINGSGEGIFQPNEKVTRAQFIKMLIKAFDVADANAVNTFTDVEKGAWYADSIAAAQKLGIVNGKEDGSFGVNDEITRQDMAVTLYRTSQLLQKKLATNASLIVFRDQGDVAFYAKEAVDVMQQAGILNGVSSDRFAPRDPATRAMAAAVIYRLYQGFK
ncbi:S-layer homology domain-containing protein [Paenibacillus periandrae]|uniref:S-layer homology domain-containing protein n=1 Tax=Paenibacillus periandrae TaxID=1761741 RepID=UPI001F08F86A|nr:S-layer homology domain-containing protein [Paenibacillus periandrae]